MNIDIDVGAEGKNFGFIRIPHSTDDSAYGSVLVPVVSIRNGEGPRILCLGAVHGDEFEGQIAWTKLSQQIGAEDVNGHLLIMPAVNAPAALVGSRVSPIDQVNLNRCFPGDPLGTPTERIGSLVANELLPLFEIVIDIHSGGNSLLYLPGPTITLDPDPVSQAQMVGVLKAFGAPHAYVFDESGGGDTALIAACRRLGVKRMGSEIGGGGITSRGNIAMTEHGILRVLVHLGALSSDWIAELPDAHQSSFIRRAGARSDHYIYANENGVFEPFVELGDTVEANQAVGQILFPETPWRAPTTCTSKTSGIIICRRAKGRTARGDGVIVLGELLQAP